MTVDEVVKMIDTLKAAYPRVDQFSNDSVMEVWFQAFKDLNADTVMKAVWKCIKECEFMPSIAQVTKAHDEIKSAESKEYYAIKDEYERCRSYYPGSGYVDYGWPEFQERLKEAKPNMHIAAARYLSNKVIGYVHDCEKTGDAPMDFAECIRTVEV